MLTSRGRAWCVAMGLAVLLSGCGGASKPGGGEAGKSGAAGDGKKWELLVGANLELSGDVAPWGEDSKQGMQLAVEELNAKSDLPFSIKIFYEDNASNEAKSKDAIKKLIIQNGVNVVVGAVGSNYTMAAMEVAKDERIPMITHASTNVRITKEGGEYVSRICFHDDFQGTVMAKFALEDLKAKTASLVIQKGNAYSEGLIDSFKKAFVAGGGTLLEEEAYQKGDTDFQTLVTKLKSANPDVVWLPGYFNEVALIIKQARASGFQKPFLGGDGWDDPKLYALGGPTIKGNYLCNHFHPGDTNPKVQDFVKRYDAKFGEKPGAMAALGYDAIYCIADAAKRAGSAEAEALKNAINSLKSVETVCGTVTMGPDREVTKPAVILLTGEKDHDFFKRQ